MDIALLYIIAGALLIFMALASSTLGRLPISTAMLYMGVGIVLGPLGLGLIHFDPIKQAGILERMTEIVVIISLFSAGLKLRTPLLDGRWHLPVRLASASMIFTVFGIALVGVVALGLPVGAAILLGAMLAPTDPVLASDVQVREPGDRDRLRFSLTGEAGLNDGSAFPFVMLGLGLLGLHDIGNGGWRWLTIDVFWAIGVGLALGWLLGLLVGRLVLHIRRQQQETVGLDDFLALGLIALSYGVAHFLHAYGFLTVFAAGLALRHIERQSTQEAPPNVRAIAEANRPEEIGSDQSEAAAPVYMAKAVLGFSEQLERVGTVALVVLVGSMLTTDYLSWQALWFVPLLFLVIRPLSVMFGMLGSSTSWLQRRLAAWFGVRGIGSLYYLFYAIEQGIAPDLARQLSELVFTVIAASVIIHGISVTPLMMRYADRTERGGARLEQAGS